MLESWRSAMALNIYRRHGSHCPGGRALHDMTYEGDEFRRNWRKCSCPIYGSGTLNRQFTRKNTERTAWPEAKAVVAEWEAAGSWSGHVKPTEQSPVAQTPADTTPSRITMADAIQAYLANRAGSGIAPATLRKHRTLTMQLVEFAAMRGYVMLDQFRSIDVDVF